MHHSRLLIICLMIPAGFMLLGSRSLEVAAVAGETVQAQDFDKIKVGDRIRVKLRRGGSYEGEVVERVGETISIKHRFGTARVDR